MKIKFTLLITILVTAFAFASSELNHSNFTIVSAGDCNPPEGLKIDEVGKSYITIAFENSPNDKRSFELRSFLKKSYKGGIGGAISYAGGKPGVRSITIKGLSAKKEYILVIRSLCKPGVSKLASVTGTTTNKDKKIISFKKELDKARKAVLIGQYTTASRNLKVVEPKLKVIRTSEQGLYYFIKGKIIADTNEAKNLDKYKQAMDLYTKALALNNNKDIKFETNILSKKIEVMAYNLQQKKSHTEAAQVYEYLYSTNKSDTLQLFNAANNAVNDKNYDLALKHYNKLIELGFTGIRPIYQATDVATGKVNIIESKEAMDILVADRKYAHPKTTITKSQLGYITKNVALIHLSRGELDKAESAFTKAKANNPNDIFIKQAEAQMLFDIAYENSKKGKNEEAIKGYIKALRLSPDNANANKNVASLILAKDNEFISKLDSLSRAKKNKEYNAVAEERLTNLGNAVFYLEKYNSLKPDDKEVVNSLYQIYNLLKSPKAAAFKAKNNL